MDKKSVIQFLSFLGISEIKEGGDKWIRAKCPLAPWTHTKGTDSNPSFAVNYESGASPFFTCFSCLSGDLLRLLELLKSYGAEAPKYNIKQALNLLVSDNEGDVNLSIKDYYEKQICTRHSDRIWDVNYVNSFTSALRVNKALSYLSSRNVSFDLAKVLDIKWDSSRGAVCFPVRNWDNYLVGLRGRKISGGYHVYYDKNNPNNPLPWFGENTVDVSKPVVMVESVFDYTAVFPIYSNLLAPLSVGMSVDKLKRVSHILDVVTFFDNGQGGDKARALIDRHLNSSVRVHKYPLPERSDPGEMSHNEIYDTLKDVVCVSHISK